MKKYYCPYCKGEIVEYKVGWYCEECGLRYEAGEPVLGYVLLDRRLTPAEPDLLRSEESARSGK